MLLQCPLRSEYKENREHSPPPELLELKARSSGVDQRHSLTPSAGTLDIDAKGIDIDPLATSIRACPIADLGTPKP